MLILAFVVYGLVSIVGAVLSRLHGASIAAQATQHEAERPRVPKKLTPVRRKGIQLHRF
jgi:hypothetical protein